MMKGVVDFKMKFLLALVMVSGHLNAQYTWYDVSNGVDAPIRFLETDSMNDLLYIAGQFQNVGDSIFARHVTSWDGSQYHVLGCPDGWDVYGPPDFAVFADGKLYTCGIVAFAHDSCQSSPLHKKFLYNGIHWDSAGSYWGVIYSVYFMSTYQGKVIAGGQIWMADTGGAGANVNHIMQLENDGYWKGLGNYPNVGVTWSNPSPFIFDAIEFNGELYINGNFDAAGGLILSNPGHAKWNGSSWNNVGNTFTSRGRYGIYNNELYLAQYGGNTIYKWNGNDWTIFALAGSSTPCRFTSLIEWNNKLVVTGQFIGINGVPANNIAMWDGYQWQAMEAGLKINGDSLYAMGNSLSVYQGSLYVGGAFNSAGNTSVNNIARWSLVQNVADNNSVKSLNIYPNPAKTELHISHDYKQFTRISVLDETGRTLLQEAFTGTVNISHLQSGFYILKCMSNDGSIVSRSFIKPLR